MQGERSRFGICHFGTISKSQDIEPRIKDQLKPVNICLTLKEERDFDLHTHQNSSFQSTFVWTTLISDTCYKCTAEQT